MVNQLHPETQLFESVHCELVLELLGLFLGSQDKVPFQQPGALLDAVFLGRLLVDLLEINNQALLDAKYRV